ncbi:MAG: acyltransferase family protein [Deltaproteobacteria bacterium]|nr:MAG: acyltransferase family protein [Deltaproteobacteria bacterium]
MYSLIETEIVRRLGSLLLSPRERRRHARLAFHDAGHGYDLFGENPDWIAFGHALVRPLYEHYFRVVNHGAENLPGEGGAILAANHSGMLPIDAAMLYLDVLRSTEPPRAPRPIVDLFVPLLPVVNTLFARVGAVSGTRANVEALLEAGELLMIFPEGTKGIGKGWQRRYQLQRWTVGHAEMALRHQVPVVPVAIIGAEEAWPQIARIDAHPFGAPWIPVPATPLPLPARFHIYYGAPLDLHADLPPEAADDPAAVEAAAARVKEAVAGLIARGLAERQGVFR